MVNTHWTIVKGVTREPLMKCVPIHYERVALNVGSLYPSADELCEAVTGAKLDPAIYVAHLNKKYSELYNVAE